MGHGIHRQLRARQRHGRPVQHPARVVHHGERAGEAGHGRDPQPASAVRGHSLGRAVAGRLSDEPPPGPVEVQQVERAALVLAVTSPDGPHVAGRPGHGVVGGRVAEERVRRQHPGQRGHRPAGAVPVRGGLPAHRPDVPGAQRAGPGQLGLPGEAPPRGAVVMPGAQAAARGGRLAEHPHVGRAEDQRAADRPAERAGHRPRRAVPVQRPAGPADLRGERPDVAAGAGPGGSDHVPGPAGERHRECDGPVLQPSGRQALARLERPGLRAAEGRDRGNALQVRPVDGLDDPPRRGAGGSRPGQHGREGGGGHPAGQQRGGPGPPQRSPGPPPRPSPGPTRRPRAAPSDAPHSVPLSRRRGQHGPPRFRNLRDRRRASRAPGQDQVVTSR